MLVSVFDYGAGNLHSLTKALALSGAEVRIESDPLLALDCDALVLPGVGAFAPAAARLGSGRDAMRRAIADGLPCLGICLGMQLFFDESDEGEGRGLGLIAGRVTALDARRQPQIGWNTVDDARDPLLDAAPLPYAYYANGYVCRPDDACCVRAWSTYESDRFPAVVRHDRTVGVQFHPEKSSRAGLAFVRAFLDEVAR
ncbi:MAG TPA: imidazole glycerol phosphate synthase subunit HisH [Gemmatimonadaceae bacterium]|nr:imidazole glycerol phosphate synthase subunit HisH [Gemmatimonadaceae bacterium]